MSKYGKVIMKALDEMTLDLEDIEKQRTPPRPGLVFDEQAHRWVKPKFKEEQGDFSTRAHQEVERIIGRKPTDKEVEDVTREAFRSHREAESKAKRARTYKS